MPPFREDYANPAVDPVDGLNHDPWPEVFQRLDGEFIADHDREQLCHALREILSWITSTPLVPGADRVVGRRALAFAWVLDPALVGGRSLAALARVLRVHRSALSHHASEAAVKFQIRNRPQHGQGWRLGRKVGA
jgi:hypothetical protein